MLRKLYYWTTRIGTVYIAQSNDGRFHPVYDDESLGSYATAQQPAEDLADTLFRFHLEWIRLTSGFLIKSLIGIRLGSQRLYLICIGWLISACPGWPLSC
jgi:hypothetical protein